MIYIYLLIPILAFIPAVFWFFIFLKEDRLDPEPKKLIVKIFIIGALSGLLAGLLEIAFIFLIPRELGNDVFNFLAAQGLKNAGFLPIVIIIIIAFAAIEEILKIGAVKTFIYHDQNFNQVVDGAIYGISAALGFATLENINYFIETTVKLGLGGLVTVFIIRFFATTLMHALTTGVAGYYLGKVKYTNNNSFYWKGLFIAVFIHSAFNLFINLGLVGFVLDIVLLIAAFWFLIKRMESFDAQVIWKLVFFRNFKAPQA